jgi:hypothetical protein
VNLDYLRLGKVAFGRRLDGRSRMTGDCHVRFLESVGVKLPCATQPDPSLALIADLSPNFP